MRLRTTPDPGGSVGERVTPTCTPLDLDRVGARSGPCAYAAGMKRVLAPLLAAAAVTAPAAAQADAPTRVRSDAFRHYACKERHRADGPWWVRTLSQIGDNPSAEKYDIGVYAAITRGGNDRIVVRRTASRWRNGEIRLTLRDVRGDDRLWIQGAYYGPADPWSDGFRVSRLRLCD